MKKLGLSIMATILLIFLAACGSSESSTTKSSDNATTSSQTETDKASNASKDIQELTIKFSHVAAEKTPKNAGALAMKEAIETASGGKIKVQVYPNSSLFGDQDEFQNLVSNNVQFIAPDSSKLLGLDPRFDIPSIPFLFKDDEAAINFWDNEGQDLLKGLKDDGVVGLYMWPNGAKHLTNSKRPITSPADLKGLKFRTQSGQVLTKIYKGWDASAESIPFAELYTSLDQGVVDGQENTFNSIDSKKFDEVQKYMTLLGHTRVDYLLLTNTTFWDSLNEPTKKIVEDGIKKGTEVARQKAIELNNQSFENLKKRGKLEITELTPEQLQVFKDSVQPIYDEYTSVIGQDYIDAAQSYNK